MKILYLYQFFKTPDEGGILRSYYLATALAEAGHEVTVLTTHQGRGFRKTKLNGFAVHCLPVAYAQRFGFRGRVFAYLKFAVWAFFHALRLPRPDRVYAASVPLTVGFTALGLRALRGVPYWFEVGDLWPQTPVELGVIRNRFLKKALEAFEKRLYRQAETIVAVSPSMRAIIESRGGAGKTLCLPNLADCQFFQPQPKRSDLLARFGTEGRLLVTYFGAMGRIVGLEALVTAARFCQSRSDKILFLLVGDGSEKARLQRLAEGLTNLRFLEPVNKDGLRDLLNITDLVYVSFLPLPVLQTNSPNKLADALAAGKPVLMNLPGWHADRLLADGAGWYVPPDEPAKVWEILQSLLNDPDKLALAGCRARQLAEREFDRQALGTRFTALFAENAPTKKVR